jgi:hypothetical protein
MGGGGLIREEIFAGECGDVLFYHDHHREIEKRDFIQSNRGFRQARRIVTDNPR